MHEYREGGGGLPVFVDRQGRRRRWVTYWGLVVALLGVLYVGLLTASLAVEPVRPDQSEPANAPPADGGGPAGGEVRRPAEVDAPE